jgi:hypothetical protein
VRVVTNQKAKRAWGVVPDTADRPSPTRARRPAPARGRSEVELGDAGPVIGACRVTPLARSSVIDGVGPARPVAGGRGNPASENLPWKVDGEIGLGPFLITVVVRLGLGAGLAIALGQGGQIGGAVGALTAGTATAAGERTCQGPVVAV